MTTRRTLGLAAAATALPWGGASLALPNGAPLGVVVIGAILGSASALTAVGLVLVWRSARIVNFAVGAMGAATGVSAIRLHTAWGWPYPIALVIGVAAGIATGVVVELVVMRRFVRATRLVATVATLGLAQLLGGIELLLPGAVFGDDAGQVTVGGFETPLSSTTIRIGAHLIDGNHLLIVGTAPLLVGALAWFLRGSLVGTAIRGAAENRDWARLLGIDVSRLSICVWGVAGAFAAATYMLQAPFVGTVPQAAAGPAALMVPLAAALVARLESLPVACGAAVALGVLDQVVRWNATRTPAVAEVALLVVILGALLLQRRVESRSRDADAAMQTVGARPLGWVPLGARARGALRLALVVCAIAAAVVVPTGLGDSTAYSLSIAVVWGVVAISVVVATGWTGQLALGQFAVVGISAVAAGNVIALGGDLLVAMAVAIVTGMATSALVGLPALRIRGPFLGITTLGLAVVVDGYLLNPNYFPDLLPDDIDRPVLLGRWPLETEQTMLTWCALGLLGAVVVAASVRGARSGRHLLAVRDNPKALEAQGASARTAALKGFVLSGGIAGLAGSMHVLILHGVRLGSYRPSESVEVFSSTTIGGLTSLWGSLAATIGLRGAQDAMSPEARLVSVGVGVLIVLWLLPAGLAGVGAALAERVRAARSSSTEADDAGDAGDAGENRAGADRTAAGRVAGAEVVLATRDLDVSFGQIQVLFGVDLDVRDGEVLALLGTNGAGKSTWLRAVMGLVASDGRVLLDAAPRNRHTPESMVRRGVALMLGGASSFPTLTVAEHLRLAGWTRRHDPDFGDDVRHVLERFPALRRRYDNLAGDLSGGERQQLALAQTLVLRPRVLLIDELSLGLAPMVVGVLLEVVREVNASGGTIVIVEQSVNVAMTVADRAVFLEKGQVRFDGPTRELLARSDVMRSVFLGGTGSIDASPRPDSTSASAPALECHGITKRYGGIMAVHDVELTVRSGEIVGLIGQNGAGKSTLLDCISGFVVPDGGRVLVGGTAVTAMPPWRRARVGIGRTFQEARLFPGLTVAETIAIACERHVSNRSMIADGLRQPRSWLAESDTERRVDDLVDRLGLVTYRDELTAVLSTGTRRIVELACLLAAEPAVLLLDEPSAGVAQRETEALGPLLRRVRDETGAAVLIVEHDMALLRSTCDRLVAMDQGAVIADGVPADVLRHPEVLASYLGSDSAAIDRSGPAAPLVSATRP